MPRQVRFTKEMICGVAIDIIREEGSAALSSRNICSKMGCSVSPIFREYANMDELAADVRRAVELRFAEYMSGVTDFEPAFKEMAVRMVRFSRDEPNLFHYLFLEGTGRDGVADDIARACLRQTERSFNLAPEQAEFIYFQLWPFLCGITLLCNKDPEVYSDSYISRLLSVQFQALLMLLKSGRKVIDVEPEPVGRPRQESKNKV